MESSAVIVLGRSAGAWALVVYFAAVLALVGVMLGLSAVLGQRHTGRATGLPYESGVASTGGARIRISSQFYLVALFFVIFDLEAAFIFAWAVAAREVGWPGYFEMLFFVGVLLASLAYLWKVGALDWRFGLSRAVAGRPRS